MIEWLRRKPIYDYTFREGDDIPVPVNPGPAVKVLIINENNFSAAETFAFMYKLAKVGPIVGLRTGGGGIGPYVFTPQLIDGGNVQLPNRAAYNPDGTSWGVENAGVSPDFEVEITPKDWMAGRDPQLEKAVLVAMEELKKVQPVVPQKAEVSGAQIAIRHRNTPPLFFFSPPPQKESHKKKHAHDENIKKSCEGVLRVPSV